MKLAGFYTPPFFYFVDVSIIHCAAFSLLVIF